MLFMNRNNIIKSDKIVSNNTVLMELLFLTILLNYWQLDHSVLAFSKYYLILYLRSGVTIIKKRNFIFKKSFFKLLDIKEKTVFKLPETKM